MPKEPEVLRLLQAYQDIWFSHFPMLSRRAEWHIAHHLCMRGRNGSPVGELYGLAKQIFLLDDATVKERLVSINQIGLCELDPAGQIYARTIATPTRSLLDKFDAHLRAFVSPLSETAKMFGVVQSAPAPAELSAQYRTLVLQPLDIYGEQWASAVDRVFDSGSLSPARRMDAKRHLISSSHWNLLHYAVRWHYETERSGTEKGGILADRLAAQLLQLTGQTLQTTRDHIAYLLEVGLFQRMPGKALHVAISQTAIGEIHLALGRTAERLPAVLEGLFGRGAPAGGHHGLPHADDWTERTVAVRPATAGSATSELQRFLDVADPLGAERRVQIHLPFTIGRVAPSDLVLAAADISRAHCRIDVDGDGVAVSDLNSTNGTFLNDQRLADTTRLKPGDRLVVGSYVLVYQEQIQAAAPADLEGTLHGRYRGVPAGR
jgi:hypothetical protein